MTPVVARAAGRGTGAEPATAFGRAPHRIAAVDAARDALANRAPIGALPGPGA
ncbi:hypothetical protein ACIRYZ_29035 [Kitasatospora sp. NPDC101155]|uniref:hypothetical protein n=1 Tax=Kitasatospora sp. NPDC101155 TaxID=3364097 RepID=UPI0038229D57